MNKRQIWPSFRSASVKLAALYMGLFAVSACVLGLVVFFETHAALQEQSVSRIKTEISFLSSEFRIGGLDRLVSVTQARGQGPTALDYLVQDGTGTRLMGEIPVQANPKNGWVTIKVTDAVEDGGGSERVRAFMSDLGNGVWLAVGEDTAQIGEVKEAIGTAFAWAFGLALLLGAAGGILISRAFLKRVDVIGSTARGIIGGDMTRRIPVQGTGDDLDHLAMTLNQMLDRVSSLMESLRQVSSDVAHDLRTPLSRLYLGLGEAREQAGSIEDYEKAIDAALNEAGGLLATFSALLRISQVEGAVPHGNFADIDLSALSEAVVDAYRPDAEQVGHIIDATICPGIKVLGDKELLTQGLANLVENAIRHTPSGTNTWVELKMGSIAPVLTVRDDGPGVTELDLPRLADRFYRGERSRTGSGNGLGLSLVAAIVELHGATMRVDRLSPGLCITISF